MKLDHVDGPVDVVTKGEDSSKKHVYILRNNLMMYFHLFLIFQSLYVLKNP